MADIILNDIVKIYEAPPQKRRGLRKAKVQVQPKRAVDGLTLTIPHGSFTVLVGPSGCGKTTLLRMIAGLEEITEGEIRMGDINITNLEPGDRGLAMVFQNYALYPHMTVRENIEFGLVNARLPRFEIRERVQKALDIVGMGEYADRRPGRISGGQRQRVALARAICALPGFVDSKNEEKTERNAGYLVVSHSGGGMLRQGTRKGIRRTPANRGMRAHWVVKGLDISEDVCHGMCP